MAFAITAISPESIPQDGGRLLTITGAFEIAHRYRVHVGDAETTVDPICYSGVRGQASTVYPASATTLRVRTPLLVPGGSAYSVLVVDLDTLEAHVLEGVLTVLKKQFYSLVYAYRKELHGDYKVGPRSIGLEERV